MKMLLSEIKETKSRREQGNLKELAENIQKEGLLQPLVINQNYELICGRRRLEAIKKLGWQETEVYQINTTDDIDKLSKAIAENIYRKQLTWQEEVKAKEELQQLKEAKYGKATCSPGEHLSSTRQIAKEIKQSEGKIAQDIQLAKALKEYPELAKERTKRRALSRLKQIKRREQQKSIGLDIKPILKCGDFRKLIKEISDNSIDLILTDPPYLKEYLPLWEDLAKEAQRVLKSSGFLICYSGQVYLRQILNMLSRHLTYYWLGMLYHKGNVMQRFEVNMFNRAKPILFFYKPPLKKQEKWLDDVLISEQPDKNYHEWGQNIEPFKKLIECFTLPNDTILDPCFGGGAVIEACVETKRNVYGFEIEKKFYDLVKGRIK